MSKPMTLGTIVGVLTALVITTATAHATELIAMPHSLQGEWCSIDQPGDSDNGDFSYRRGPECEVTLVINPNSYLVATLCVIKSITKTEHDYFVVARCKNDEGSQDISEESLIIDLHKGVLHTKVTTHLLSEQGAKQH